MRTPFGRAALAAMLLVPGVTAGEKDVAATATLRADEKAAGFRLLFDGRTTKGWRGFKSDHFPEKGWSAADGLLSVEAGANAGDIVTEALYGNFDFRLEYRLSSGANSGIKYLVDEALAPPGLHGIGFEYQLIDDERHPDAKAGAAGNRTCGALYDLIGPRERTLRAIGEWNEVRLVVQGPHVEHWLNGAKMLEFERASDSMRALIAVSKYKSIAGFGTPSRGHILIQDHGDAMAFRNIRIRELPAPRP